MQDFNDKKILLGVCGGVAAYKSAFLVRELVRAGAEVQVVMTQKALEFITPMTFQALSGREVRTELFDSQAEKAMGHIELARWADYLLIAPATANCLAKLAQGYADDLLSTLYLVFEGPVVLCPAMNRSMWAHPATQTNQQILAKRGVIFAGPDEGSQACGEQGYGRLCEPEFILNALRLQDLSKLLQGREVLITAGPTREALDPVRYISNRSSGRMGYALAQAAQTAGAKVTLISGPTPMQPPPGVERIMVETAEDMHTAVRQQLKNGIIFIGAAAVADYHCPNPALEKLKKTDYPEFSLELTPNADILAEVAASGRALFTVGFAAETQNVLVAAQEKLQRKNLDMIIANQVGPNMGFDAVENEVIVLTPTSECHLSKEHKVRLAGKIISLIAQALQKEK